MNELGAKNVQEAQRLLNLCPALPKAIVQAQLKQGIVPPHVIHVANIMLGSHYVPQSYTQSRILLDHGKFPDTIKKNLGTGPDSGSGIQLFGQIHETQNHREFPTTVNQETGKRVLDGGSDSTTQPSKRLKVKEEVFDSGSEGGSDPITQPSKLLRVKEEAFNLGFDGGSDSITQPSNLPRVKEEVFDPGFDGGSDSISHPSKRLRVKEEERSEPVEQAPSLQVGQVQLSPELLKLLLEKQMLRLPVEKTKATLPPLDQQQQQQWRGTYSSSRPPFPIFTN